MDATDEPGWPESSLDSFRPLPWGSGQVFVPSVTWPLPLSLATTVYRGSEMFKARYHGNCAMCEEYISPGDDVTMVESTRGRVTVHVHHVQDGEQLLEPEHRFNPLVDTMPRGKTAADRCDRCFIIHASGQTECY